MDYKDWQKQFREKFTLDCGEDYGICLTELYPYKIESFISSLLQQKDQEYTDKIKKNPKNQL